MQKKSLLMAVLAAVVLSSAVAQHKPLDQKVIYKWEREGLIYYSHIKPLDVRDFIKLDAEGRRVEDFTEDFDEIVEIVVARPKPVKANSGTEAKTPAKAAQEAVENELAEDKAEEIRNKNCETARNNMAKLEGGEVYQRDSEGNMIRLKPEQVESKRKNVQRDVDYFCNDQQH